MAKSDDRKVHPYVPKLVEHLEERRIGRRDFLRTSTLLGLSATTAYGIVGRVLGEGAIAPARAQGAPQKGGIIKISMPIPELKTPHSYSWSYDSNIARQVNQYLTRTDHDNLTRPLLLESWQASDDLKTWTLNLRRNIAWSNGDSLVADHVIWNLEHWLDPAVGSSMLGLMDYLTKKDNGSTVLWDASAIEKVDDHTVRLNAHVPQVAVPEHLFHYPALILHPEQNGEWGVGAIGTGAFTAEVIEIGKRVVLKRRDGYWGEGPYLDELHFIDLGDDPSAEIAALAAGQVDGQHEASITQYAVLTGMDHLRRYDVITSQTGVARMKVGEEPFNDPRVRKAMRLALDTKKLLEIGHLGIGAPGEHHHVAPVHPAYVDLGLTKQDIEGAKELLAQAGYPDGLTVEIYGKKDPDWEPITVQAMVEMWQEIGVDTKINIVPSSRYWEIWTEVPFGFTAWQHRPLAIMTLSLAYRSGGAWNESDYSNPRFDELLTKAEATLDIEERQAIMREIEQIMLEDGPIALPLWRGLFSFWNQRVGGFQHHPTSYIFGEQLYLEQKS